MKASGKPDDEVDCAQAEIKKHEAALDAGVFFGFLLAVGVKGDGCGGGLSLFGHGYFLN